MFDSLTVWTLEELALFQFVPQCLINNFSFWVVINMGTLQVPHHYTECRLLAPNCCLQPRMKTQSQLES